MHLIPNCFLILFLMKTSESKVKVNLMTGTLVHNQNCDDLSESLVDVSQNKVLSCAALCGNNETCELCYWKQETCFICAFGNVKTVEVNEDGFPIGIKSQPEDETVCPTSIITLPATTTKLTTPVPVCPENYARFLRGTVHYCLGIEVSQTLSTITKDQGIELCEKVGARITGPNTIQERDFLRDTTIQMFGNRLSSSGVGVWIDGSRTKECDGWNVLSIATCSNITAFSFSDSTLKDRFGYMFIPGQPDGAFSSQNCLQLMVTMNNINGLVDDLQCTSLLGYGAYSRAIACGKSAV